MSSYDSAGNLLVNVAAGGSGGGSVNVSQIGGVATQMATANSVAYTNIPETALGLDNGTTLDKLVGLNGFASIEQMIAYYIRKGQGFSATTGIVTSGQRLASTGYRSSTRRPLARHW